MKDVQKFLNFVQGVKPVGSLGVLGQKEIEHGWRQGLCTYDYGIGVNDDDVVDTSSVLEAVLNVLEGGIVQKAFVNVKTLKYFQKVGVSSRTPVMRRKMDGGPIMVPEDDTEEPAGQMCVCVCVQSPLSTFRALC